MKAKAYEKELRKLQVQLCHLQEWVKEQRLRVVVVFEGRDGAGKGGTIRAITERVSPRVFRVVALPAPSDREKSQIYMQRYMQHFPAAGEVVIFRPKRADRVKILVYDGTGLVLYAKGLEAGRSCRPSPAEGVVRLSAARLATLLEGSPWHRLQPRPVRRPSTACCAPISTR